MRGNDFFKLLAAKPPFTKLSPQLVKFFKDYLSNEKVIQFGNHYVINTNFPPYPGRAFDALIEQFSSVGEAGENRRLFSVTWAVTNRCRYNCWHCYNAGRSQKDISLSAIKKTAKEILKLGAVIITLTGGEPLLRKDLEEIVSSLGDKSSLILGTTGDGLTEERAKRFKSAGLFGVGISLDSLNESEHDMMRGRKGAFKTALKALRTVSDWGLYPYVVSVATREFLKREHFFPFLEFVSQIGAREIHLLEPSPTGKLSSKKDVVLSKKERDLIFKYQDMVSKSDDLPVLSSFAYIESENAFGCGAGLTHIYIDGSGEVCPCNLVPMSFGNIEKEELADILNRMGKHFQKPRPHCIGQTISPLIPDFSKQIPSPPDISEEICRKCLPRKHKLPLFFKLKSEHTERVGAQELRNAYNKIHEYYDEFWLKEAAAPVDDLIANLKLNGSEYIFEAGCGTGYGTSKLLKNLKTSGKILAADLSKGMLEEARRYTKNSKKIKFICGDALEILSKNKGVDLVFTSWVLGYIKLTPFFNAVSKALTKNGRLAFIVHKENSPKEPLEIFSEIIAEDESALTKQVAFDFPGNINEIKKKLAGENLEIEQIKEDSITFKYKTPEEVLEHLLKSGAGTAYYEAIATEKRNNLEAQFIKRLKEKHKKQRIYKVVHKYFSCIAKLK